MRFNSFKRCVCAVLSLVMVTAALMIAQPDSTIKAGALSESELKSKISDCEEKAKEIQNKIDSLQDDKDEAQALVDSINAKIANLEEQIGLVNDKLDELNDQIEEYNNDIADKEKEIAKTKQTLKKRLRAIYVAGTNNQLSVLLSADDYADYLAKSELMKGVTNHDKELLNTINNAIKEINEKKAAVKESESEVKDLKATLTTKQNQLDKEYSNAEKAYNKLVEQEASLEKESAEVAAIKEAAEAEWQEIINKAAASEPARVLSDYDFAWPFSSSYYISSPYGWRWGRLHAGIDISCSGAYGKPIYAAADGRVITSDYNDGGYGNYLIINHGSIDGTQYSTLYAHCSSVIVGSGEEVSKGQLIAYVGNSGRSTGPHLHFEIRVNGTAEDPLGFYQNY